ncbi:MAG: hypothetical protein RIC35_02525 [Marinoscillum sp.]
MKKASLLTTGFLAAALIFAANDDARGQGNTLAFNENSGAKTETKMNNVPFIAEGTSGQARDLSALSSSIVLYISGGQDPKYSAEDYAKMFRVMFNDPNRTDYPSNIYVRFEESGEARQTAVKAYVGRKSFDKNGGEYESGDGVFTPAEVLSFIPQITEQNAKANGLALLQPASTSKKVALN